MGWLDGFFKKPKQQIKEVATPDRAVAWRKLQESFNSQPDLFASLMDRYFSGGEWWQPVSGIPMLGGTSNREHGRDTYGGFYTEQDLRFQRDAARLLYAREPVAKAIEGHLNAFVIGKGMSYKICPKKDFTEEYNTPEGEKRLRQYQQAIDEWLDEQQWPEREQECYTCKVVDGEFFLRVTIQNGKVIIRRLEPEHIQNPVGKTYLDGWYLGVKIDLKDAETPLAYGYKPDGVAWQEIPAKQIIHFKANVTRNVSRGISDFYPITDDLKSISQLLDNICAGAAARAEIPYMWSVKNATPAAISAFADDKADRSRINSITGKTNRSKGQQSGKAIAHGDNVEFTTMPQGDVEGSVSALQASLRMVGNRFCMPEYMVSADASNANYASTQMAGTPFVRKVEIEQSLLKRPFKQILTMVMEQAVVKGVIPTSEFAKLDIEIECGSPVIEDEYQQAQMYDIMRRNGVISPQKWCMAKGMDYEEVQRDLNEWNESNMQAPDLGQQAGGTAFNAQREDQQQKDQQQGQEQQDTEDQGAGWQTIQEAKDASGHEHKSKGPGGGQFASSGGGGSGGSNTSSSKTGSTNSAASKPAQHHPTKGIPSKPGNQSELLKKVSKEANDRDLNDAMRENSGVSQHFDVKDIPANVASQFDAHGADLKGLTNVLNNGIDKNRSFFTETLGADKGGKLLRDHSNFLLLGHPGHSIADGGVGGVIVDEMHTPNIPDLKAAFPGVAFIPSKKAKELLPKVAATGNPQGMKVKYAKESVQENTLDASNHLHKGKGVGGGQFTGKGDGGNNNRPIPLHKGANMKTQKHPIDSESQQQYLVNKYGASGYRVHNLKYAMPKESKSTWAGDESGTMGGVSSFANFGNAVDDIIFGASESVTGDNYSSQLRNDGGKVGLLVLMGKVKDGPGSEVVIKAAKIAAVVTEEELEQIFKVAVKEDLTRSAEAGENGVKPEDADKMTVKALLEKYSFDGGDRDAIFGRMEELLKEKLAKG